MPTYTMRNHRIGGSIALALGAIVAGVGAGGATFAAHSGEEIDGFQVDATLQGDRLSVVETIDYDFGPNSRRGIVRDVDLGVIDEPGTRLLIEDVSAASATANDELLVSGSGLQSTLRVGNPNITFRGVHRYQLGYDLVGVPEPRNTGGFVYVAIGDGWEVPIKDVTVRLAADFEPQGAKCSVGSRGSFESCDVVASDGVVTATVPRLDPEEGVVLEIEPGRDREPAELVAPSLDLDREGTDWGRNVLLVGIAAALAAVVGSLLAGRWVRRAGADLTGSIDNPTEAAFTTGMAGVPISDAAAAEQVTVQFVPPEGLTPPQGAVVEREQVDDAAKTAWLAQAVIDGWISLSGDPDKPVMTHTERADRDPAHMPAPLAAGFAGRREVPLGSYDKSFAAAWTAIGEQLESWKRNSGLWDVRRGARNRARAAGGFVVAVVVAGITGLIVAGGVGQTLGWAIPMVVVAGFLVGAGIRALAGTPTLAVRNPAGFALWLRTEGFRRFLAESEGEHARWAADNGLLREYSAWAVALGELDRWNSAAARAGIAPNDPGMMTTAAFVGLSSAARTTSVNPSSSGSSGGFSGGGFSGGVGGGGGGSW